MSTAISWTNETWNPVVGCEHVSEGCDNCYAKTLHDMRHKAVLAGKKLHPQYAKPFEEVQVFPERLTRPLRWREPRRVFVNSVSDLFHKDVPLAFLDQCFVVMAYARRHTFQILTKRPHRMRDYMRAWVPLAVRTSVGNDALQDRWDAARRWLQSQFPGRTRKAEHAREYIGVMMADMSPVNLPNVWLGTSVEHQAAADKRIPFLLDTPAKTRFLSCEPLLGPVDLSRYLPVETIGGVEMETWPDWVIVGGESGPKRREMDLDWLRGIVTQCVGAGVATFVKQDSAPKSEQRGRIPDDLWIREYPTP